MLLKSRVALAEGRIADARAELDRALAQYPDDPETLRSRCQFLFEQGAADEAEQALKCLIDHDPDDAAAHYNLGTLLLRTQRYDEAVLAYRQALRCRPNHPATHLNLAAALAAAGDPRPAQPSP